LYDRRLRSFKNTISGAKPSGLRLHLTLAGAIAMKQFHILNNSLKFAFLVLVSCIFSTYQAFAVSNSAHTYYVATDGDDNNPGSATQPWRTIQKAADTVAAGSTVYVRGGIYPELVTMNVSGSTGEGYITFRNAEGEIPILDGTGLGVAAADGGMVSIRDQSHLIIQGFEIRNYQTSTRNIVPVAINVRGKAHHIEIRNNHIHNIETNAPVGIGRNGADAHGIAVYGTSALDSINNIIIDGNELNDLKLGSSEALVLNGNVESFTVSKNIVHDINNIAVDCIGFEGTCPDPAFDRARNGVVSDNTVYRVSSFGNPSYGNDYAAGGIYIDGGRDIVVERNTVYQADIGIEIASEHHGGTTSNITVRNNLIFENAVAGIAMGGYDTDRGATEYCTVVNNTLYHNDTLQRGSGEVFLQFEVRNNSIANNILSANSQSLLIGNPFTEVGENVVDYNLYFAPAGSEESEWEWENESYQGFSAYQTGTGNDTHSWFTDPKFIDPAHSDFHLQSTSPAIDSAAFLYTPPEDRERFYRPMGSGYDLGCYEFGPGLNATGTSAIPTGEIPQVGAPITITISTQGTGVSHYRFFAGTNYGAPWNEIQPWSSTNSCTYTPASEAHYVIVAHLSDTANGGRYHQAGFSFATSGHSEAGVVIQSLSTNLGFPQAAGTAINLSAQAYGPSATIQYKFWSKEGNDWQILQEWSENNTATWTPIRAGTYTIVVWANTTPDDSIPNRPVAGLTFTVDE